MAETLFLADGTRAVIFGDPKETLRKLIQEQLGDDAERLYVYLMDRENDDWEALAESAHEKEQAADGYLRMCHDALEAFDQALSIMDDSGRLDRHALYGVLFQARKELYANL